MPDQNQPIEVLYVEIASKADRLITEANAAVETVVRRMGDIDKKAQETESVFGRLGKFIKEAFTIATGIGMANVGAQLTRTVIGFGKALIDTNAQMQMYQRSFEVLTGSAEEAGEIIEWVKEQAKATPFDVPGLIQASQMLMTWGLDLKEWFTVVGDVAAGMNRPLSQVVNAVGTLASGQTGEAVRRFRDLGINLREYTQLEFDAQGSLVTPLQEAIPIVRQIMVDRFGGMMESQSKTWAGVMSNMRDTWMQFVQVMGEPIFETLNEALSDLYAWIEENADQIENFARNLGALLGGALNIMVDLLSAVGQFIVKIDELMSKVTSTTDWMGRGIQAGREVVGLATLPFAGIAAGVEAGRAALGGESGEAINEQFRARLRGHLMAVAGIEDETEATRELEQAQVELTEAQRAGVDAVREMSEMQALAALTGKEMTDEQIRSAVVQGTTAEAVAASLAALEELGFVSEGATEQFKQEKAAVMAVAQAHREGTEEFERHAQSLEHVRAGLEAYRAEQERLLTLATDVALALTDNLEDAMVRYQETAETAAATTAETIQQIEAEAAQAERDAVARHQAEIGRLRDEFAREQISRRRRFNLEWARLIRDQNQEVLDAEWEYEYQKENLLIEGDEIALAELEARYAHEKDVRGREQQDARDDMQANYDLQGQERQERFELQMRELEERLAQELDNIRQTAQEKVESEREALEERLANEDERMQEHYQKLGQMLYERTEGELEAANIILAGWKQMYAELDAEAIRSAYLARQEMEAVIAAAMRAAQAVVGTPAGGRRGSRGGFRRHEGGYTPAVETSVLTLPNEFVLSPATTQALEGAAGGPLTQQNVRQMAESRRVLDVNVMGVGVGADMMERLYYDLLDALRKEGTEF